MPRSFDRDDHHQRRLGMVRKSDEHNGWTNYDTWHVAVLIDQNPKTQAYVHDRNRLWSWTAQSFRDWAIVNIIGPTNASRLKDAQEYNAVPLEERFGTDPDYEDLRQRAEGSPAWELMGSPPEQHYEDDDPTNTLIDPEMVNWQEIINNFQSGSEPPAGMQDQTTFPAEWNNDSGLA